MKSNVKLIGITGGIGSGKSIMCKIFSVLGTPVYDADSRAKWLMSHEQQLIANIKTNFGEEAYFANGKINNVYLAKKVFHVREALQKLNALVHPAVKKDFKHWCSVNNGNPYLLKEAALLFESGSYKELDHVILVTAPKEIKINRVLKRDKHRSKEQILAIMEKQMSDAEKMPLANYNIINDGKEMILPQVLALHMKFSAA